MGPHSPRRIRVRTLTGLSLALGLVIAQPSPVRAQAAFDRSFGAGAEASGMYTRYGIPGFLAVEDFVDGGGPVADATLNSDGTAHSFASSPYPGGTFVNYPGLAAVVVGSAPPGYPLYATASHPTQPEQAVSDPSGAYRLFASANDRESASDARAAAPQDPQRASTLTRAQSSVAVVNGRVSATAVSLARGFAIGPLSIAVVKSTSVTTYASGAGQTVSETALVIEGGRVGDVSFSFGPDGGLEVADRGSPVPAAEGLSRLNSALEPMGLSVAVRESRQIEGGASAAALEIVSVREVPGAGQGTLRIRLGGARSWIRLGTSALTHDTTPAQ